jgi:hypothetical protein
MTQKTKQDKAIKVTDAQAALKHALDKGDGADVQVLSACCITIMQGGVPVRICWPPCV